jgi:hypothetical protein
MHFCKPLISLAIVLFLLSSCGGGTINIENNLSASYKIAFVHESGLEISLGECINSSSKYALLISATDNTNSSVFYEFNGRTYEASILTNESKLIDIDIIEGLNLANISGFQGASELYLAPEQKLTNVFFD